MGVCLKMSRFLDAYAADGNGAHAKIGQFDLVESGVLHVEPLDVSVVETGVNGADCQKTLGVAKAGGEYVLCTLLLL